MLELIYTSLGAEEVTGSIEIDMGPLVGKGEVYQVFHLNGETVTSNGVINAYFNI